MPRAGSGMGGGRSSSFHSSSMRSASTHHVGSSRPSMSSGHSTLGGRSSFGGSSSRLSGPKPSPKPKPTTVSHYSEPARPKPITHKSERPRPIAPPPPPLARAIPPTVHAKNYTSDSSYTSAPTVVLVNSPESKERTERINAYEEKMLASDEAYKQTSEYKRQREKISSLNRKREENAKKLHTFNVLALATLICFVIIGITALAGTSLSAGSTRNREKLDTGIAFKNDFIVDEIGWFDNVASTETKLQDFYEATGIQPYIVLLDYNASLSSDSDYEEYANSWYEENIDNESTLLFMYFAAEDVDGEVGAMTLINGKQVTSIMDSEAVEIFWGYIDQYWYTDLSTDDLFITVFDKTADAIMKKSTTTGDVAIVFLVIFGLLTAGAAITIIVVKKKDQELEKLIESEKILNTKMSDLERTIELDETLKKYV